MERGARGWSSRPVEVKDIAGMQRIIGTCVERKPKFPIPIGGQWQFKPQQALEESIPASYGVANRVADDTEESRIL